MSDSLPKLGVYKHFKGSDYKLLHIARHSEDKELYAVYISLSDSQMWVRPLKMFTEMITNDDGEYMPRFQFKEQ